MAQPLLVFNQTLTLDLASSGSSSVVDISNVVGFAVHEVYTGSSPTGTILVEGSNDGTNFSTLDSNAITTSGNKLINFPNANYVYVRLTYTRTSGTGTLTTHISAKIV